MGDELQALKDQYLRLVQVEKHLAKVRKECEDRKMIWDAVDEELAGLEEKAVIYRYKVGETQDEETKRETEKKVDETKKSEKTKTEKTKTEKTKTEVTKSKK